MQRIDSNGYSFYFVLESSGALHIERRTGINTEVAIDTFFEGVNTYNDARQRNEANTDMHGVYWTWLYGDETSTSVLVLSCFEQESQ